jgi:hypothetical protein
MGGRGAAGIAPRRSAGRCGGQTGLAQPALQGPGRRHVVAQVAELGPDVFGSPQRMGTSQVSGGLIHDLPGPLRGAGRVGVVGD